jgi:BirA family biotin operon repressor/biotin-[acetyl-CoA-carboxylase] ligase
MENIGDRFIEIPTVDSTNIYAMQQVHARLAKHGFVYFAHEQTQGKGQRGRSWESRKGDNITLSAVFEPLQLPASSAFLFSSAIAVACYNFCKVYTGDEISIKWPNDLYWRDRKAGGILVENIFRGSTWDWSIVGIGLNINQVQFAENLVNPVSFRQITGRTLPVLSLAKELCFYLQQSWEELLTGGDEMMKTYNDALYKRGETVKLKQSARIFDARIDRVNKNGQLEVFTAIPESFNHGDVTWIL